jgi:hypothetical protein
MPVLLHDAPDASRSHLQGKHSLVAHYRPWLQRLLIPGIQVASAMHMRHLQ